MTNIDFDINEGVIPQNFSWRAGIGTDTTPNVPTQQQPMIDNMPGHDDLYDGGIKLHYQHSYDKRNPFFNPTDSFYEDLVNQIDTLMTDVAEKYIYENADTRTQMKIKDEMKQVAFDIKKKYGAYMHEGFMDKLYNRCSTAFRSFCQLPGATAMTEFIYLDGTLHINPLLIYQFFQL